MIRQEAAALRRSRIAWVDINFIRPETIAAGAVGKVRHRPSRAPSSVGPT
jgi:hypothetical protein